jgi:hypothetical protein
MAGPTDPPRLTPSLAYFARRHLRSLADLEILLLLWRDPDRWWTAEDVARELQTTVALTRDSLLRLSGAIVASRRATETEYRLAALHDEQRKAVESLAELHRADRFQLIRLIAAPASTAIQDFADAFDLKKKEDRE